MKDQSSAVTGLISSVERKWAKFYWEYPDRPLGSMQVSIAGENEGLPDFVKWGHFFFRRAQSNVYNYLPVVRVDGDPVNAFADFDFEAAMECAKSADEVLARHVADPYKL